MSLLKDKCSKCGAKVSPGYDFCLSCGTKFSDVAPTMIVRNEFMDNRIEPSPEEVQVGTKKTNQPSPHNLAKSVLYISAFGFYIIGIILMSYNVNTINHMGVLYGAPFVVIGLILNGVGSVIGTKSLITIGKILLYFGGFLLFLSLIPILAVVIFASVGGW
jgi:hypothetical protein